MQASFAGITEVTFSLKWDWLLAYPDTEEHFVQVPKIISWPLSVEEAEWLIPHHPDCDLTQ